MNNLDNNVKKTTSANKDSWDEFWRSHFRSNSRQKLLYLIRTRLIAKSVKHFTDVYFKDKGVFVEIGSGSSQTSVLIKKKLRLLYCLDFVIEPLLGAKHIPVIDGGIQGDLFHLPFRENSISGIWNLGVMEHFTNKEISAIFKEFNRILKPGACAILFWPPLFGWYNLASCILGTVMSFIKGRKVKLYPDEINLLRSKKQIYSFCNNKGFIMEHCRGVFLDFFTYVVVVIRKN